MRILFVCDGGIFSGLERITLDLATGMRNAGDEVRVLASHWGGGEFVAHAAERGLSIEKSWFGFLSLQLRPGPLYMTAAQLRRVPALWSDFRRVVRDWRPSVVHHSNFHHVLLLACGPNRRQVPHVFHVHGAFQNTRAVRLALRRIDGFVDRFIAVSAFVGETLERCGVPASKIDVVLNGVVPASRDPQAREAWRAAHGIAGEDVAIGIVGQVAPWKGHEDFVDALAVMRHGGPRVRGVMVGGGPAEFRESLMRRARDAGLTDLVVTGFVRDVGPVYSGLDVLAVPSRFNDPCPLAVAEGLSRGLPVVATRRGGIPEMFGPDLQSWLVPGEHPRALAEALGRLAASDGLRREVGAQARARAQHALTLDRVVRDVAGVYRRVVGRAAA